MPTNINNVRGVCSYTLYRHAGGLSPDGVIALAISYVLFDGGGGPNTPIVFKDDVAAAETPPRLYPEIGGFTSQLTVLTNDDATSIFFSMDGIRDHGEIKAGETIQFDFLRIQSMWLRGEVGGESYRLWVR